MATTERTFTVELSVLDRNWIKKCIDTQKKVLLRSINNENSEEVKEIRRKELNQLNLLIDKV